MHKKDIFQYVVIALTALLSTLPWLGYMAGDTVIHLIFAENAASGNWFTFNKLIPSGGESSPLYLIFVTALYKLSGAELIPYILIGCNVTAWLGVALLTRSTALALNIKPLYSTLCALAVAAMPGSVRNAVLGMENVYLALGLLIFLNISIKLNWLTTPQKPRTEFLLGLLLAAMACLRTEATIVIAILALYRHFIIWKTHKYSISKHLKAAISPATAALLFLIQLGWYYHTTNGQLPFAGGLARQVLAAQEAWFHLGPVAFNGKILTRLAAYFPLTLLALSGAIYSINQHPKKEWFRVFTLISAIMIPFFATLLPSGHLGRYTIFLWPLLALLAAYGWQNMVADKKIAKYAPQTGIALCIMLLGIYLSENILRYRTLAAGHPLKEIAQAPSNRPLFTNQKIAEWNLKNKKQINVAINEVQLRYFMDDRIKIISLDGIVNSDLRKYVHNGYYDHLNYLKDEHADIIAEFPNFNADKKQWALDQLQNLQPGSYLNKENIMLSKLPNGDVKIDYPAESAD